MALRMCREAQERDHRPLDRDTSHLVQHLWIRLVEDVALTDFLPDELTTRCLVAGVQSVVTQYPLTRAVKWYANKSPTGFHGPDIRARMKSSTSWDSAASTDQSLTMTVTGSDAFPAMGRRSCNVRADVPCGLDVTTVST